MCFWQRCFSNGSEIQSHLFAEFKQRIATMQLFLKISDFFLKHQGLLAALGVSCLFFLMCMYASVNHTYGGVSLHVYTREPARIYVSAHTYVCIRLYVYMLLRPSIPYDNPVWVSRHQGKCVPGDGM